MTQKNETVGINNEYNKDLMNFKHQLKKLRITELYMRNLLNKRKHVNKN